MPKERETKEISAIHERDLDKLLQRIGAKEKIDAGEVYCKYCKETVTNENLYSILPESGGINFVCDKPVCIVAFTEYAAEKNKNKPD